jgi:cytochrome c-type biogenesis protein CcmH
MNALATACIAFAAGCFAALALRGTGAVRRDGLAALLLPLLAASIGGGLYAWYANPAQRAQSAATREIAPAGGNSEMQELANQMRGKLGEGPAGTPAPAKRQAGDLHDLAKQLAAKLERDPGNAQGWALLARTYANIQQFADADRTFEKASKLLPGDAQLLADWAEARVASQGGTWDPRAREILKRALAADPRNEKAVALGAAASGK